MKVSKIAVLAVGGNKSSMVFPLLKFKDGLMDAGFGFTFLEHHKDLKNSKWDIVILTHRYFYRLHKADYSMEKRQIIYDIVEQLREKGTKVIYFDFGDSTGSRDLDVIDRVDLFLKKQLHKNKDVYTHTNPNIRAWVDDEKFESEPRFVGYTYCEKSELEKLSVGWNIGFANYHFGIVDRIPRLNKFLRKPIQEPRYTLPSSTREIDISFRGKISKNTVYSYQRNSVIACLEKTASRKVVMGDPVPKRKYLNELRDSKIAVSPFGWGEICYRDFEAAISGCLLMKPSMEHLETFPSVFESGERYIALNWDLTDFGGKFDEVLENYDTYLDVAIQMQKYYQEVTNNSERFVSHLENIFSRI